MYRGNKKYKDVDDFIRHQGGKLQAFGALIYEDILRIIESENPLMTKYKKYKDVLHFINHQGGDVSKVFTVLNIGARVACLRLNQLIGWNFQIFLMLSIKLADYQGGNILQKKMVRIAKDQHELELSISLKHDRNNIFLYASLFGHIAQSQLVANTQ